MRQIGVSTLALLILACSVAGCGQKGNLYLPNQKKKVPAPPAVTTPSAAPPAGP